MVTIICTILSAILNMLSNKTKLQTLNFNDGATTSKYNPLDMLIDKMTS